LNDDKIIELYWQREDSAIAETDRKYGKYCMKIAFNILMDVSDAEETVNDTYLKLWDSIPPQRPFDLRAFTGRITRNLSINLLRHKNADKRGKGEYAAALHELDSSISDSFDVQREVEMHELSEYIAGFISKLDAESRNIFLGRYWYFASIEELSKCSGFSKAKIKSMLFRTRKKLLENLKEEGLC